MRLQGVAREDGDRLVESAVDGRPPASQIVVVHRGQVVVDQRIGVQAFERCGRPDGSCPASPERTRRLDREKRPEPLAAAERRIAHGFDEAARPRDLSPLRLERELRLELRFDRRGGRCEPRLECLFH